MIGIIDYGAGNIRSVFNAFTKIGRKAKTIKSKDQIKKLDAIVLPGVGSFAYIDKIEEINKEILDKIDSGTPYLGICLGMQWLFENSEENQGKKGLEIIKGTIKKFPKGNPVPQIGWNKIKITKENELLNGLDEEYFYFVHSYYCPIGENTTATTDYGIEFTSAIAKGNIYGTQFHPEKSGKTGLKVIENFLGVVKC